MWREKIIEAKKSKLITTKMMSDRTRSRIPAETITRILTGKTKAPRIDTVLELGESVGLSSEELFSETNALIIDSRDTVYQAEIDKLTLIADDLMQEVQVLEAQLTVKNDEIKMLNLKLEHSTELIKHKDDIINLMRAQK